MDTNKLEDESVRIRKRMLRIRCQLDREFDNAVGSTRQFLDWSYYVQKFPLATMGAIATASFLLSPGHRRTPTVKIDRDKSPDFVAANQHNSSASGILPALGVALGSAALRIGMSLLTNKVSQALSSSVGSSATEQQTWARSENES